MTTTTIIIWALAVGRITRLINNDMILDKMRVTIAKKTEAAQNKRRWNRLSYFLGCPWCVSMWVAGITAWVPIWHSNNLLATYLGIVLAASYVVGIVSNADSEEIEIKTDYTING